MEEHCAGLCVLVADDDADAARALADLLPQRVVAQASGPCFPQGSELGRCRSYIVAAI